VASGTYKRFMLIFAVLTVGFGFVLNTFIEARDLHDDYLNRILPAMNFVQKDPGSIVVVNSHFVTMELAALFEEKHFFLAEDTNRIKKLIPLLKGQGQDHFIYINNGPLPDGLAGMLSSYRATLLNEGAYRVSLIPLN
jgi:hypothetical protein